MAAGFFITGSDTGVGKTWIGCQLIMQLQHQHPSLKVRKPVESGCQQQPDNTLLPADGMALFNANDSREHIDIITPYRFRAALAPDRAAHLENKTLALSQLFDATVDQTDAEDLLIVEGAGGFYSPLTDDGLNSDLAKALGLPVILIIEDRLGAINQALLSVNAIEREGLTLHCIILNQQQKPTDPDMDNFTDLLNRVEYSVFHCPFNGTLAKNVFSNEALQTMKNIQK